MKKSRRSALALVGCALAVGWLLGTPGVAIADFLDDAENMVLVGTGEAGFPLSKLAPWPHTDGRYFYSGCYHNSSNTASPSHRGCFVVVDVKDHTQPKIVATVESYDHITSPKPPPGHAVWTADAYNNLTIKAPCGDWVVGGPGWGGNPTCWDPGWVTRTHFTGYGIGKVLVVNTQRLSGTSPKRRGYTGIALYDVHNPEKPKFLSRLELPVGRNPDGTYTTGIGGVHHLFYDGRYAYLGAEYEGFIEKILVIVDLHDPRKPVEVGKWWLPGQRTPQEDGIRDWTHRPGFSNPIEYDTTTGKLKKQVGNHYISVYGNRAYLSYHQGGLIILDVKDKRNPNFISRLDYLTPEFSAVDSPDHATCNRPGQLGTYPKACGNTHSAKLVPGGGGLLWITDEYFSCPYGHLRLVDVSDEYNPRIISHFLLPGGESTDCAATYTRRTPSSHLGNAYNNNLLFLAWYGAGVRAIDISDPYDPKQVGFFSYNMPGGGAATYDVIFGPGGLLYVSDSVDGIRVLNYTGTGMSVKP